MATKVTYTFIIPVGKVRYFKSSPQLEELWRTYCLTTIDTKVTTTKEVTSMDGANKLVLTTHWPNDADYKDFESKISSHTDAINEYNRINNIQVTRVIEKL